MGWPGRGLASGMQFWRFLCDWWTHCWGPVLRQGTMCGSREGETRVLQASRGYHLLTRPLCGPPQRFSHLQQVSGVHPHFSGAV